MLTIILNLIEIRRTDGLPPIMHSFKHTAKINRPVLECYIQRLRNSSLTLFFLRNTWQIKLIFYASASCFLMLTSEAELLYSKRCSVDQMRPWNISLCQNSTINFAVTGNKLPILYLTFQSTPQILNNYVHDKLPLLVRWPRRVECSVHIETFLSQKTSLCIILISSYQLFRRHSIASIPSA